MKLILFIFSLYIVSCLYAQQEKKCTINDAFQLYYEGEEYSPSAHSFSFTNSSNSTSDHGFDDTISIEKNPHTDVVLRWRYRNGYYDMYYPAYDTVLWFYNDSLLDYSDYSFSTGEYGGGCGMVFTSGSTIKNVVPGCYQLRSVGTEYGFTSTNYPVVHVYDQASVLNQTPQEDRIAIYPNPVSDKLTVELEDPKKELELHIYDLNGRRIKSIEIRKAQKSNYPMSTLGQGIYLCTLYDPKRGEEVYRIKLKKL